MRKLYSRVILLIGSAALSGCESIPDITVYYYLPKASTSVQVVQSVDCDAAGQNVLAINNATVTTNYSADSKRKKTFKYSSIDRWYTDDGLTFNFFDDGRIKSINASTTGQAAAIVKSGVTLATAIARGLGAQPAVTAPCAFIKTFGGNKPISITYKLKDPITYPLTSTGPLPLIPEGDGAIAYAKLRPFLPVFSVTVGAPTSLPSQTEIPSIDEKDPKIFVTELGSVAIKVEAGRGQTTDTVWEGAQKIPLDTAIPLPLPKPEPFGKLTFSLTLNEAGQITALGYDKTSGASSALDSSNTALSPFEEGDTAQQAAALKAKADLIAQQQRLLRCESNPAACN